MTNTINNVPRELKKCAACRAEKPVNEMKTCMHHQMHRYVCDSKCMYDFYNPPKVKAAPSPAGVDGLEVIGYLLTKGNQLSRMPAGSADEQLCRLSDAQAIIDGLRGQVEELGDRLLNRAAEGLDMLGEMARLEAQRDQLAGLLRESGKTIHKLQAEQPTPLRIARYMDAMRAKIDASLAELK